MNKISHEKIILGVMGVVLVGTIGAYIVMHSTIQAVVDEVVTVREEYEQVKANEQTQEARAALLLKTKQNGEELDSYVLSLDNPTPVLMLVEQLGVNTGVAVEVDSLAEELAEGKSGESHVSYLRMALSVSGDWESVYHLLRLLDEIPYVAQIDNIALEEVFVEGVYSWEGHVHMRVFVY